MTSGTRKVMNNLITILKKYHPKSCRWSKCFSWTVYMYTYVVKRKHSEPSTVKDQKNACAFVLSNRDAFSLQPTNIYFLNFFFSPSFLLSVYRVLLCSTMMKSTESKRKANEPAVAVPSNLDTLDKAELLSLIQALDAERSCKKAKTTADIWYSGGE